MKAATSVPGPSTATAAVIIVFCAATLFLFLPGSVYLTNTIEFSNTLGDLVIAGAVAAAVASLVLAVLLIGLKALGAAFLEKGLALLFASGVLLWLQGNFLLWDYGPLDGRAIPWSAMHRVGIIDGLVWVGGLVAAFLLAPRLLKLAKSVGLVLIIVQLAYGAALFLRQPETPSFKKFSLDESGKFSFSRRKNVILIVLDSFQTDAFDEIVRTSPEVAAGFDGFTYFRNALGGYPFTELSVALMLTGRYYDNSLRFEPWKRAAFQTGSLPSVLKANGWEVDLYPKVSYSLYYSKDVASNIVPGMPRAERMLDLAYVFDLGLFRSLPHYLKRPVYNNQDWFVKRIFRSARKSVFKGRADAPRIVGRTARKKPWRQGLFTTVAFQKSQDVKFVDTMLHDSRLDLDRNVFKLYHLSGPHIPLVLDENLSYVRMDVSRGNYLKAATASLKLTTLFLKRLRKLGAYDDTMVFIVGDHGAGFQGQEFHPGPMTAGVQDRDVLTQPARINALPLVLVKPFGGSGALRTSDAPVSLADIPATAFRALGLDVDAPGESMFAVDAHAARERRYLMYSGRDIYSYYGDMDEYLVSGPGWADASWRRSGKVFTRRGTVLRRRETYSYGFPLDMKLGGSGIPYLEYGWQIPEERLTWSTGRRALMVIPIGSPHANLVLSVTFRSNHNLVESDDRDILVSVNGTPVGRWAAGTGQERTCEAAIPAGIAGDTLRILFEIPGAVTPPGEAEGGDINKLGIGVASVSVK
jgi:hypothetical protein